MVNRLGWLVNDQLTSIPETRTFWHDLLEWIPGLAFRTGSYVDYSHLADVVEASYRIDAEKPQYIIRNSGFFRWIDLPVVTISFVQDLVDAEQVRVIKQSQVAVFNSIYMRSRFEEVENSRVIPIGVNTSVFRPMGKEACRVKYGILPESIVWVGARTSVKGYETLKGIIESTPYNYCLVLKDSPDPDWINERVRVLSRIPMGAMAEVYNACSMLLCTSPMETQHLASLEALACDIPVVSPPCGVWYDTASGTLGLRVMDSRYLDAIRWVQNSPDSFQPREFLLSSPYTGEACRQSWQKVLADVL